MREMTSGSVTGFRVSHRISLNVQRSQQLHPQHQSFSGIRQEALSQEQHLLLGQISISALPWC